MILTDKAIKKQEEQDRIKKLKEQRAGVKQKTQSHYISAKMMQELEDEL